MNNETRNDAGTGEVETGYGWSVDAALMKAAKEDIRLALRHYSHYQAKRIFKRFGILAACLGRLQRDFDLPSVRLSNLRQMFPVVLVTALSDDEKIDLVCRLYSEIAHHPQWTPRGNVEWIARHLRNAISEKQARLTRVETTNDSSEPLHVRKAA